MADWLRIRGRQSIAALVLAGGRFTRNLSAARNRAPALDPPKFGAMPTSRS
jgi:hypothetical protein